MSAGGREQGDGSVLFDSQRGRRYAAGAGSLSIVGQVPIPRVLPIV